jgi:dinuclear metal center YbgI/SA1388 family protein
MKKKNAPGTISIRELIGAIEDRIPVSCSESWDQNGLICGDANQAFSNAVVGLDLTENLLTLAVKKHANLIILHHPPLFPKGRGIQKLILGTENETNTLLLQAFQKNICIYVAHTNFDRCAIDGMIQLARDLGGEPTGRLFDVSEPDSHHFKKLVTYIPKEQFIAVRDALYEVGCGHIGNYDSCGFSTEGQGNFRPLVGSNPTIGILNELETVSEIRFETLVVSGMEQKVIEVLKHHHPYEEVAYDFYPVEQKPTSVGMVWGLGFGFIAELDQAISYDAFIKKVKKTFQVDHLISNQVQPKKVNTIAFSPGKGSSFVKSIQPQSVDVYLTGEVGYHDSVTAGRSGLNVIELGHQQSELYFLKTFHSWFREWSIPHQIYSQRNQQWR